MPDGKIKIETKLEMRLRGAPSPNKADALCLTEYFESSHIRRATAAPGRRRPQRGGSWKTA